MTIPINWLEIKDGNQFQGLCNKILFWEVSKDLVPFGAMGKDKGTDAQLNGTYNGKTGEWKFQYKFHDPTMDKGRARGLIKSDLKKELEKIKDENIDFYVFITNVKLTKYLYDDLMVFASNYDFEVNIWDGEKLESLLPKYPYIIAYYFGFDLPLFEPYQEKFKAELKGERPLSNHATTLQGRLEQLESVRNLLADENCKILLIAGNPGIGKTRIGIEAAKLIENSGEWTPLFVRTDADYFDSHLHELTTDSKYIIIVDNAELYSNTIKLINLANRDGWHTRLKIILITQPNKLSDIKKNLYPNYNRKNVAETIVTQLSGEDTVKLMEAVGIKEDTDQRRLFNICKDSPRIAIMAAKLYSKGIEPSKMSQEEIISINLDKSLDPLREAGNKKHLEFMDILAAILPISVRADNIHKLIAEKLKIEPIEESNIIQDLINEGLITIRGGKLRIIPGLLSEHILYKKCYDDEGEPTGYHNHLLNDFMPIVPENIINNLTAIEYKFGEEKDLLADFSEEIIALIPDANNAQRLNILNLLETFAFYRPLDTLEIIDKILKNPQPDTRIKDGTWGEITITDKMVREECPSLLINASHSIDALPAALNLLKEIALKEERAWGLGRSASEKLQEICKIEYERDIWIRNEEKIFYYTEVWHEKMLNVFNEWLLEDDEKLQAMTMDLMNNLMKLESSYGRTVLEEPSKFVLSRMRIVRTNNLNRFRKKVLEIMFSILRKTKYVSVKVTGYGLLGNMLRDILNHTSYENEEHKNISEGEKETIIASFARGIEQETNLRILNLVESGLRPLRRMGDKKGDELIAKFVEKPEYRLYKYLLGQHREYDTVERPDFWSKLVKKYTENYAADQLSAMMVRVLDEAEQGWSYGGAGRFMIEIGENYSDYAKRLLEHILAKKNRLIEYAGCLLSGLRYHENETALKYIRELKNEEDIKIKIMVVDSYKRMRGFKEFTQEDIDILKEFSGSEDDEIKANIAEVLPNLKEVNIGDYLDILKTISSKPDEVLAEKISDAIIRPRIKFSDENFETIKLIASEFINIDDLDKNNSSFYRIERLFGLIALKDPCWLIEFFEKRINQCDKKKKKSQVYDAIPHSLYHAFKDIKDHKKYKDILRRVRDWTKRRGWYFFEAPMMLKNLCSIEPYQNKANLNASMSEVLIEWVNSGDKNKMENVAYMLGEFREDELYYKIVSDLIIKGDGDPEILGGLSSAIFSSSGTRTRSHGHASPVLLRKIEHLNKLRDASDNFKVKKFAERQIKSAKEEIDRELERDEDFES